MSSIQVLRKERYRPMDIAFHDTMAVFRTPFSDRFDLVQAFSGVRGGDILSNHPVDFRYAALTRRECRDIWHADRVLALSTDEAPPQLIDGGDIGGNHGAECAILARVLPADENEALSQGTQGIPGIVLSPSLIGTGWKDARRILFTCIRVPDQEHALFVSENLGPSEREACFAKKIEGSLTLQDASGRIASELFFSRLTVGEQIPNVSLQSAIRHERLAVTAVTAGKRIPASGFVKNCDYAEIEEVYSIIHPATVAPDLRAGRPAGGWMGEQDLALFGQPMFRARILTQIRNDGTVLVSFSHRILKEIRWEGYLGLMFQEKCHLSSAGVRRVIPGMKPIREGGHLFDFSRPLNIAEEPFPQEYPVTEKDWLNSAFPPSREIEQILTDDPALPCISFAAGILPVQDGTPEIRREQISDALCIVPSRKTYLTFLGHAGPGLREPAERSVPHREASGTVFRKYYPSDPESSLCQIRLQNKIWLFADFYLQGEGSRSLRQDFPDSGSPSGYRTRIVEQAGDVTYEISDGRIRFCGSHGYLVLEITLNQERNPL